MIIVQKYRCHTEKDGSVRIQGKEKHLCPCCQGHLQMHDTRLRRVIRQNGRIESYRLRRLRCRSCGKLHTELPDFIAPYKHYGIDVIESDILHMRQDCPADNRTSQRWKKIFVAMLASVKYLLRFPRAHWPSTLFKIFYGKYRNTHPLCLSLWNSQCYNSS